MDDTDSVTTRTQGRGTPVPGPHVDRDGLCPGCTKYYGVGIYARHCAHGADRRRDG